MRGKVAEFRDIAGFREALAQHPVVHGASLREQVLTGLGEFGADSAPVLVAQDAPEEPAAPRPCLPHWTSPPARPTPHSSLATAARTSSYWLNLAHTWCAIIKREATRSPTFDSVEKFYARTRTFIDHWNKRPHPWTKTVDEAPSKVANPEVSPRQTSGRMPLRRDNPARIAPNREPGLAIEQFTMDIEVYPMALAKH